MPDFYKYFDVGATHGIIFNQFMTTLTDTKMKKGTYIKLFGKPGKCPRCKKNSYGFTSKSDAYNEKGKLIQHYEMNEKFCTACAYVEGDSL